MNDTYEYDSILDVHNVISNVNVIGNKMLSFYFKDSRFCPTATIAEMSEVYNEIVSLVKNRLIESGFEDFSFIIIPDGIVDFQQIDNKHFIMRYEVNNFKHDQDHIDSMLEMIRAGVISTSGSNVLIV